MKNVLIYAAPFQTGWLCCVLAGANNFPWLGTANAMLIVIWHVLGAVSGPVAYFAGHKLGGVQFPDMAAALLVLAGGWAVSLPLLMALRNRFDGKVAQTPRLVLAGSNARV